MTGDPPGVIRAVIRNPVVPRGGANATSILDPYYYGEIDPQTGGVVRVRYVGVGFAPDTLQMVGSIGPGRVVPQGTTTGVPRIGAP